MKIQKWVINIHDGDVYAVIDGEYVRIGESRGIRVDGDGSAVFSCYLEHNKKHPVYYEYSKRRRKKKKG